MRIAYLILAHKEPELLKRLVSKLSNADADIYIQLDNKSNINEFRQIGNVENTYFINKRIDTVWGNYSIIESTLIGFKQILKASRDYTHINLLSGQDYPLKPIKEIQDFLFDNQDKTFMRLLSIDDNEWLQGNERIAKYSFGDFRLPGKYSLQRIANAILPNRKLPLKLKAYGGSQWLTITPECALYAINYLKNNTKLKRFFRATWAIDEILFQTILMNSPLKHKLVNDNLRFIEQHGNSRPTIFTVNDADRLITSGKFFARKFDMKVDSKILDRLDALTTKNV
ncbi:beta-1,6-N-acetylglucosaminyltransferase [Mucilaginibacter sp.]